MSTINSVGNGLSGTTGSGNFVGSTSPTLITPTIGVATASSVKYALANAILDANGVTAININSVASAVNYIGVSNNITGNPPYLVPHGSDTNINLLIEGKGTGYGSCKGTGAADNAVTGYIGELISSTIASGSPVSVTTATAKDITSISLTAGDWDLYGNGYINPSGSFLGLGIVWMSTTSATLPDGSLYNAIASGASLFSAIALQAPYLRVNVSSTTTVYLSCYATFASGTCGAFGGIFARRAR